MSTVIVFQQQQKSLW